MLIKNSKLYDILKWIAQIFLPALATLYTTLGALWDWHNTEGIVGTIVALDFFLGVLLGINTKIYNNIPGGKYDGHVNVIEKEDGGLLYSLELGEKMEELENMDEVHLKVNKPDQ